MPQRTDTFPRRLLGFCGRWLRRAIVVAVALIAGWVCAGYAEGDLPGTIAQSDIIQSDSPAPLSTQPTAMFPATQPTTRSASATSVPTKSP